MAPVLPSLYVVHLPSSKVVLSQYTLLQDGLKLDISNLLLIAVCSQQLH